MSAFLNSVKADLLDRRLLPILALLAVALVGALAYAVLGGGSSGETPPATHPLVPTVPGLSGVSVSPAPANPNEAVAETTSGAAYQRAGLTRNPFTPLPTPSTPKAAAPASSSTTPASASTTSSPSSTQSTPSAAQTPNETSPATTPKASAPKKPKIVYKVTALFGQAAPGTPTESANLTPYPNLVRQQPIPTVHQPFVVFRGVTAGGLSAAFTIVSEAFLHGSGNCLPSTAQCEVMDLKEGQSEEFETLTPGGAPVTYRLEVKSIASSETTAAVAKVAFTRESRAGRKLLHKIGRAAMPYLHYSSLNGVLAFASPAAFASGARVAAHDGGAEY